MAVQKISTATILGINAALVEVEADVSNGLPITIIVGLPDTAVQESKERVRSAIKHSGFSYPQTRVSLNLAPGSLPKIGTHFDLPISLAILLAGGLIKANKINTKMFAGELSLDGTVKQITGVLAIVEEAKRRGFEEVFVPKEDALVSSLVGGINVYPVENLRQLTLHLQDKEYIEPFINSDQIIFKHHSTVNLENDFAKISGQRHAKRALEIAASGGHNILMTGPPGSGKTMLAKSFGSIMPTLSQDEILELTKIYNSSGKLETGIITERPFRNPHHTASQVALVGGGGIPKPGEVTLAHNGVLFLDELPEFSSSVLEVLRQPLEENEITVTRARYSFKFPASFILVAAQNPCPCGNFGQSMTDKKLECVCHPTAIQKYQKKISGPLMDRIDLHITVPRLDYDEMMGSNQQAQPSSIIRQNVERARRIQTQRFNKTKTNSALNSEEIKKFCKLDEKSGDLLKLAADKYQLSGRTIHRILKVARTIADLEESVNIEFHHLAESLQYRLRDAGTA